MNAAAAPTVMEIVRRSGAYLDGKGVEKGRLDGELIVAHVLRLPRLDLYLRFDRPMSADELAACRALLRRRAAREPLQYVLGTAPFRELHLEVGPGVAIPRPETEYFLDALAALAGSSRTFDAALDVGTGSGAIALALADEGLARTVVATDISPQALATARRNARAAGQPGIDFRAGHLLDPVCGESFDLVLSNPPYVTDAEWRSTAPEVREWEPRRALAAGADGLAVIRELVPAMMGALRPGGWAGLEVGRTQAEAVAALFRQCDGNPRVVVREDLASLPRYVFASRIDSRQQSSGPPADTAPRNGSRPRGDSA